jgi:maltose O-acetyltransferase
MSVLDFLLWLPIERLQSVGERLRTGRLARRLAYCGERVVLSEGVYVERPELVHIEHDVSLARHVGIMGSGAVRIGHGAMLATHALILTTTHDTTAPVMRETGVHRSVTIGANAWIGANAIVLPGVTIGDDAVVGAGAVVTRDVPSHQVVAGVPASPLGQRTSRPLKRGEALE